MRSSVQHEEFGSCAFCDLQTPTSLEDGAKVHWISAQVCREGNYLRRASKWLLKQSARRRPGLTSRMLRSRNVNLSVGHYNNKRRHRWRQGDKQPSGIFWFCWVGTTELLKKDFRRHLEYKSTNGFPTWLRRTQLPSIKWPFAQLGGNYKSTQVEKPFGKRPRVFRNSIVMPFPCQVNDNEPLCFSCVIRALRCRQNA